MYQYLFFIIFIIIILLIIIITKSKHGGYIEFMDSIPDGLENDFTIQNDNVYMKNNVQCSFKFISSKTLNKYYEFFNFILENMDKMPQYVNTFNNLIHYNNILDKFGIKYFNLRYDGSYISLYNDLITISTNFIELSNNKIYIDYYCVKKYSDSNYYAVSKNISDYDLMYILNEYKELVIMS